MSFSYVVLRNICIKKDDLIPRKLDLTFDDVTNKRTISDDVRYLLDLIKAGLKNHLLAKVEVIEVRDAVKLEFWKEKRKVVGNAEEFWDSGIHEIKGGSNILCWLLWCTVCYKDVSHYAFPTVCTL